MKIFGKWVGQLFGLPTVNVCLRCVRDSDERVGQAGDYSLCARCRCNITSVTGFQVREHHG